MRCKNCGWENPDHLTRCEKCNTPLDGVSYGAAPTAAAPQQNFNKTVSEASAFAGAPSGEANVCPQCGYPMRPGVSVCPNCHYGANPAPQARPAAYAAPAAKQVKASPMQGTVNPWVQVAPANKCVLEPVAQEGIDNPEAVHLKGDAHELNRANLDPENQTITSKVQACLVCEDGQWFIEDKSAQHTTFVYAGTKTALKDGDVILMGNRQFVFHVEK